jgi:hypothetical protein
MPCEEGRRARRPSIADVLVGWPSSVWGRILSVIAWLWRVFSPVVSLDLTILVRNEVFVQIPVATEYD